MIDQPQNVTSVKASINGHQFDLGIKRHALPYFEADNGSALQMLHRLTGRAWHVSDVVSVLNFASNKQPSEGTNWMHYALSKNLAKIKGEDKELTVIDAAISENGAGNYAVLASMVLYAALYGLNPEDAHFDDAEQSEIAHG